MKTAFWFWLLMLLWLVYGVILGYRNRPANPPFGPFYWGTGWNLLLFVLLALIGWHIFPDPFATLVTR